MNWPGYFPENCPPDDASEASGIVYRFVSHNPPDERDFRSQYILKQRDEHDEHPCAAYSISVLRNIDDVPKMQKKTRAVK